MQILIAPNAFKNGCTAAEAAEAIESGLKQSRLRFNAETFPIADGGDGTGDLLIQHLKAEVISTEADDPLGRKISSRFGLIRGKDTAVIEMADASGLRLLGKDELNPLKARSDGTGQLILAALDHNVTHIILGIGGSATVDGGLGIMQSLGLRCVDGMGNFFRPAPGAYRDIVDLDLSTLDERTRRCRFTILCDVDNPLLGAEGSAAVFGPQKGASESDITILEAGLSHLTDLVQKETGKDIRSVKHGGAAGGVAALLSALLGAELKNGIDTFLDITGFRERLKSADIVITGEGSIDEQTLKGKGPYGVAKLAKENGKTVIGLSGKIDLLASRRLYDFFDVILPIINAPGPVATIIGNTKNNLVRTARELGNLLAMGKAG